MQRYTFRLYDNDIPEPKKILKNNLYVIFQYCNISELYYTDEDFNNYRFELPDWVEFFDMSYNSIYEFYNGTTYDYPLPSSLKILNASFNKLNFLPDNVPKNLIALQVSNNSIKYIPALPKTTKIVNAAFNTIKWFDQELPNLVQLNLSHNHLTYFRFDRLSENLRMLDLTENQLIEIDSDFPKNLVILKLGFNRIKELPKLPEKLEHFDVHKNKLTSLPEFPNTLKYIDCSENDIKTLPDSLKDCKLLEYLNYENNEEMDVSLSTLEFIDKRFHTLNSVEDIKKEKQIKEIYNTNFEEVKTVYRDSQNVHNIKIRKDVVEIIEKILEKDGLVKETFDECINILKEYFKKEDTAEILKGSDFGKFEINEKTITMSELFPHLFLRLKNKEFDQNLIDILEGEIQNTKSVCFSGRIEGYVTAFQGFDEDFVINLSIEDQIMAKVNLIQEKLYKERVPVESLTYQITMHYLLHKEFTEMEVEKGAYDLWMQPLEDIVWTMIDEIKKNQDIKDFKTFIPKLRLKKIIKEYFEKEFLDKSEKNEA